MRYFWLMAAILAGCAGNAFAAEPLTGERAHESAKLHTELAGLYFERSQMGIALSEVDLALKSDPDYAPAYNVRGVIYMELREDADAEKAFLQSLRLDKDNSETHNNYGWFLCQRDREKDSIGHFLAAVKNPLYATPERAYLNAGLCSQKMGANKDAEDFLQRALRFRPDLLAALQTLVELKFADGDYAAAKQYLAAQGENNLTAGQLWFAVRIERRLGDANAEAKFAQLLRQRYPDARETQLLMHGE